MLGVKSTFLVDSDSGRAAALLLLGVPPAVVSLVGEFIVLLGVFRPCRSMDFRPWNVGSREVKLGLLGLETMEGIAGRGFEGETAVGDVVGGAKALVGRGGRGRIDLVLSDRTRPICFGGETAARSSSDDDACSTAVFSDLTLFDRGRKEALPGEAREIFSVFDRASDALVGVSNEGGKPFLGRGKVDGRDAA